MLSRFDPPPLNWSIVYDRNWLIKDGNETTQTSRDSYEATLSRCACRAGLALDWRYSLYSD